MAPEIAVVAEELTEACGKGSWIIDEFLHCDLGNEGRYKRLHQMIVPMAENPSAPFCQVFDKDGGDLTGAYRLVANDKVESPVLLEGHILQTGKRAAEHKIVLCPQDTTSLDLSHFPTMEGLGPLETKKRRGLFVHSTLALTPERLPLGILDQQVWARDPDKKGKKHRRKNLPIEQKESYKWLKSVMAVNEAAEGCPNTTFVSMGDRENDVFDVFILERAVNVELLVRASWNRAVEHPEGYLWAKVLVEPITDTIEIQIPRRQNEPARVAILDVRFCPVTLRPPRHRKKSEGLEPVQLWAVMAKEESPPEGVPAVEWLLLSTIEVANIEQALEKLSWYAVRWCIEIWHKVLKSGCKIEERRFKNAERVERCLSIYSVIAWRILFMTLVGRVAPEVPCDMLLTESEWKALYCVTHKVATPPKEPPMMKDAVRWIGKLGGFVGRKSDGVPGVTTIWKGLIKLADMVVMFDILAMKQVQNE